MNNSTIMIKPLRFININSSLVCPSEWNNTLDMFLWVHLIYLRTKINNDQ